MPQAGTWKAGQLLKNQQRRYPPNRTYFPGRYFKLSIRSQSVPEHSMLVIHCASSRGGGVESYRQIYLNGARNLLNRFVGTNVLFTSSTSVYAQRDGSWVTEESETNPARETGRLLLKRKRWCSSGAGRSRGSAGIYGPGRSALLSKFLAGTAIIDPESDRFVNQVHRDDIASALFLLLTWGMAADSNLQRG